METAFLGHPDISEVAVHAVHSDVTEDDVKVTAVLVAASTLTEAELCTWSTDKLPYFAVPRYIEFRDELPKNPVGRVLKYVLRDEGKTERTWIGSRPALRSASGEFFRRTTVMRICRCGLRWAVAPSATGPRIGSR